MEASLVMFKADGVRRDFPLRKDRFVLGRTNTCDLRIPLPSVSRKHCEVVVENGSLSLRDLGSSNGTYHNGNRIQEATLSPGDEITIGPVIFRVIIDGEPQDVEPVQTVVGRTDSETDAEEQVEADEEGAGAEPLQEASAGREAPEELKIGTDDELPENIEEELNSPTVDVDDGLSTDLSDDDEISLAEEDENEQNRASE